MSGIRYSIPIIRKPYVGTSDGQKICLGEIVEYKEELEVIRIAINFDPNLNKTILKQAQEKPECISILALPQKPDNLLIIP